MQIVDCLQEQKNEKDGHSYLFEELKSELSDECKRSHVWQSKAIDSLVRYKHINVLNRSLYRLTYVKTVVTLCYHSLTILIDI